MPINQQMLMQLLRSREGGQRPPGQLYSPLPQGNAATQLVGNTQLPSAGLSVTPVQGSKSSFNVTQNGRNIGALLRGGPNGRFVPSGPIQRPLAAPQPPMQGMPLGGGMQQPQRQYAQNPFAMQQMQAQMMRQPTGVALPPPKGGLQYG